MAKKMTKTEQGRATRAAEKAARAAATKGRRDSAAAAQKRSGQRDDGGTSDRMSQRESAAGMNIAGNNTMSGRGQPMPTMSEREEAAGLNLAGNNTMSGRGQPMPTMSEREEAAGLNLAGNNTLSGRGDSFYQFSQDLPGTDEPVDQGVHDAGGNPLPAGSGSSPSTFVLDVVKADNTAGTATFNGPGINLE
tara:strand:+ start:805 stop:1380 length:576 start_codon:yes stop_codon:yes gene_type:complete